jgi:hypothetical protein
MAAALSAQLVAEAAEGDRGQGLAANAKSETLLRVHYSDNICCHYAGAISWSHQPFSRVKLTMTKLNAVESEATWRQLPVGQQVHERYTALAKHVLQFEKQWFQGWRDNVDNAAMRYLKQPIFTPQGDTGEVTAPITMAKTASAMVRSQLHVQHVY